MTMKPQQIIRLAETNLDGTKPVKAAIRGVRGVSFMTANYVTKKLKLEGKTLGQLTEAEHKKLEDMLMNMDKAEMPLWMLNRRRDPETGENGHLVASKLQFTQKMDINLMRKLKTYKGIRHAAGLPVRGQRTRSSFRKGTSVGVKRKQEPAAAKKK